MEIKQQKNTRKIAQAPRGPFPMHRGKKTGSSSKNKGGGGGGGTKKKKVKAGNLRTPITKDGGKKKPLQRKPPWGPRVVIPNCFWGKKKGLSMNKNLTLCVGKTVLVKGGGKNPKSRPGRVGGGNGGGGGVGGVGGGGTPFPWSGVGVSQSTK